MLLCARRISASLPCGLNLDNASPVLTGPAISSHLPGFCRLWPCGHSTGSWAHGWPRHPSRSLTASFSQALVRPPGCVGSGPRPSADRPPWPPFLFPARRPSMACSRRESESPARLHQSPDRRSLLVRLPFSCGRPESESTVLSCDVRGPRPRSVPSRLSCRLLGPSGPGRLAHWQSLVVRVIGPASVAQADPARSKPQTSRPTPARPQWYSAALATRPRSPCLHLPPGPMGPGGR